MYSKVLVALDFHNDNEDIVKSGEFAAKSNNAELFLIHVIEPLVRAVAIDTSQFSAEVVALMSGIEDDARVKLTDVAERLSVPAENCMVRTGRAASEIHAVIKEKDIDLVVIGTHGQSGIQLLLGSTANSVLHGSICDVLAVRVGV